MRELTSPVTLEAVALNLPYVVGLVAVAAEIAWIARRPGPRRRAVLVDGATALAMAAGALGTGIAYVALLRILFAVVSPLAVPGLGALWQGAPLLGGMAAFLLWDAAGWAYHWLGHRTAIGWAGHQPHHSGAHFDLTVGLRQSWFPLHGLVVHPVLALAGFDLRTVALCAAVSNCLQVLQHTAVVRRLPRSIEAAVMTPGAHRHHHAVDGAAVNLGPVLTVWDRLAGTWVDPAVEPSPVEQPAIRTWNPVTIELRGWRDLVAGIR